MDILERIDELIAEKALRDAAEDERRRALRVEEDAQERAENLRRLRGEAIGHAGEYWVGLEIAGAVEYSDKCENATISVAGAYPIRMWRNGKCAVQCYGRDRDGWSESTYTLTEALSSARRQWLTDQAEAERRRQEQERLAAEDAAAIAQWTPAYRTYIEEMAAARCHNRQIAEQIAETLGAEQFQARRLTYGVVYDTGADPTMETIWITGDSKRGAVQEIQPDGQIEVGWYLHPVKVAEMSDWTPQRAIDTMDSERRPAPPVRRQWFCGVEILARPSVEPICVTVDRMVAEAGGLMAYPSLPPRPTVRDEAAWNGVALEIEHSLLAAEEREALGRALHGREETEIPF